MQKVLIIAPYSIPSACGIWVRVRNDAQALKDAGYSVTIFTSNVIKGTNQTSEKYTEIDGIKIYRFPVLLKIGGTAMIWLFMWRLLRVNPNIIHTHGYRHPHSLFSLIMGKLLRKKVILTTHAPFKKDPRRSMYLKIMDIFYDLFFGWWELRLYNKVIRISKWEESSLKRRGLKKSEYIPNGITKKFVDFDLQPQSDPTNRIIFMGRIDPVKRIEWIVQAAKQLPDKHFVIHGPIHGYLPETITLFKQVSNVEIIEHTYTHEDFIKEVSESDIYVLPSIRESLGITLLESMAVGAIPVTSNALGPQDIIENGKNGFVVFSSDQLASQIKEIYSNWEKMKHIIHEAKKTSDKYDGEKLGKELVNLYKEL